MSEVKIGQVWADNDKRSSVNRKLRVVEIGALKAKCWSYYFDRDATGRFVWVRLDRFKPTATGYRLVQDIAAPVEGDK